MPTTRQKEISVSELRCLRALGGGGSLTPEKIGRRAGLNGNANKEALEALLVSGLAAKEEIDVDGTVETAWRITAWGAMCLDRRKDAGAKLPNVAAVRETDLKVKCLVPLFGTNRILAPEVGKLLAGCKWVGIPFVGGLSELPYIKARTKVCNDLHCHILNLATVVADEVLVGDLVALLRKQLFHQVTLRRCQQACKEREESPWNGLPDVTWAADYFVAAWQSRSGTSGTKGEFNAPLSIRWEAAGGDSVMRFRNAVEGLLTWNGVLADTTFVCMDALKFLDKCKDIPSVGIFADPPFPGPGDGYKHSFTEANQVEMAEALARYNEATVVCRFYDVPFVREMYREDKWKWHRFIGRKGTNATAPECLITNKE